MAKYSGSGWHFQSERHSKARTTGRAGGTYAEQLHSEYPNLRFDEKGNITGVRITNKLTEEEKNIYLQQQQPKLHNSLHTIVNKLDAKTAKTPEAKQKLKELKEDIKHIKTESHLHQWFKKMRTEYAPTIIGGTAGLMAGIGTMAFAPDPTIEGIIAGVMVVVLDTFVGAAGATGISAFSSEIKRLKKINNNR
jgi:flagellar basal body-associated protein FliL